MSFPALHRRARGSRSSAKGAFRSPPGLPASFTLVELLVVVAVIAVLAALMAPSLKSARDKAKEVQCLSNMRQIGIAMRAYSASYGGWVLPYGEDVNGSPLTEYWAGALDCMLKGKPISFQAYIDPPSMWNCPANPANVSSNAGTLGKLPTRLLSYAVNTWVFTQMNKTSPGWVADANTSKKVLLLEYKAGFRNNNGSLTMRPYDWVLTRDNWVTLNPTCYGFYGHREGMNVLFCDLHAEWLPQTSRIFISSSVPRLDPTDTMP